MSNKSSELTLKVCSALSMEPGKHTATIKPLYCMEIPAPSGLDWGKHGGNMVQTKSNQHKECQWHKSAQTILATYCDLC